MNQIGATSPVIQPASESILFGCAFSINVESFLTLISKITEFFAWLFGFSSKATIEDLQKKDVEVVQLAPLSTTQLDSVAKTISQVQEQVIPAPVPEIPKEELKSVLTALLHQYDEDEGTSHEIGEDKQDLVAELERVTQAYDEEETSHKVSAHEQELIVDLQRVIKQCDEQEIASLPPVEEPVVTRPISKVEQELIVDLLKVIEKCERTDKLKGLAYLKVAIGLNKGYKSLIAIARSFIEELKPGAIVEAQSLMAVAEKLIAQETFSSDDAEKAEKINSDLDVYRSHVFVEGLEECLAKLEAKLEAVELKNQEAPKIENTEIVLQNAQEFMSNPMKLDFGVLPITIDIVNSLEMAEKGAQGDLKEKVAAAKNALLEQLDQEYKETATSMGDQAWEEKETRYNLLKEFNALMKSNNKFHLPYIV